MRVVPKILIVDDEQRMCESLKALLDHHGYDTYTSNSGEKA
jgi:DNA-binding response OmpR family regulator